MTKHVGAAADAFTDATDYVVKAEAPVPITASKQNIAAKPAVKKRAQRTTPPGEVDAPVKKPRARAPKTDPISIMVRETEDAGKQTLVFVNAKRSAESVAEDLAQAREARHPLIAKKILRALSSPTTQCRRLAFCVERGTAFHHSGLSSAQRRIVEEEFLSGNLTAICATPTLAAGVNVPAFRVIIRDLHRFEGYMTEIPVLEYRQMIGRAGRPDFHDDYGEAITIAKSPGDGAWIEDRYWNGTPEPIYSKLSNLPALRMAVLSLYATRFVRSREELFVFFSKTFFAHQYGNITKLEEKLIDVEIQLTGWGFLSSVGGAASATPMGRRVSMLYIDPLSASILIAGIESKKPRTDAAIAHLLCSCIELRPLLRLKTSDFVSADAAIDTLLPEPSMFSAEYEEFLQAAKTSAMLGKWMDEAPEETILAEYGVRPGELKAKLDTADWLLYGMSELAQLLGAERREFIRARIRMKHGVKAELVPLLRMRGIGRVRARALFNNGLTSLQLINAAPETKLAALLGVKVAARVKEQLAGGGLPSKQREKR